MSEKMKWTIPSCSFRAELYTLQMMPVSGQTIRQSHSIHHPWKNLTISRVTRREMGTKFIIMRNQVPNDIPMSWNTLEL